MRRAAPPAEVPTPPARRRSPSGALFLLLLCLASVLFAWARDTAHPEPVAASLRVEAGSVTIVRADARASERLSAGDTALLQRGDQVVTEALAAAVLSMASGQVTLDAGTSVAILQLQRVPLWRGLEAVLALERGELAADMGSALTPGGSFSVETDVVTVSGPTFRCVVTPGERVRVDGVHGRARVTQGEDAVSLQSGQYLSAALGQPLAVEGAVAREPEPTRRSRSATTPAVDIERTLFPPTGAPPVTPAAETHTVQAGETLYSIAQDYGLSWETLWQANQDLSAPDMLREGQVLRLPGPSGR
jgi:LysM repeat protein